MKKIFLTLSFVLLLLQNSCNANWLTDIKDKFQPGDERGIRNVLESQVKYANKANITKFISTYDDSYKNSDGFDLPTYSKMVQELWDTYDNIKYGVKIQEITLTGDDTAEVKLVETSFADIPVSSKMSGVLKSKSNSIYYLKKIDGKWKVTSDKILDENTSMLYGDAVDLDIKLSAPLHVKPNYEYTASLEFVPPKDSFVIASIAKDKVEYPQKPAKEVFRKMPEDNILERLFISNSESINEYIVASIGITKADIQDLSIKLSLTGFGYQIIRVNVDLPEKDEACDDKKQP